MPQIKQNKIVVRRSLFCLNLNTNPSPSLKSFGIINTNTFKIISVVGLLR